MGNAGAKAALLLVTLLGMALLGEVVLRTALPAPEGYFVYPPGLDRSYEPESRVMPGVSGTSRFRVNSLGLRGDELPEGESYRVLAVGGSTTQCLYLDHHEAWPGRLQQLLDGIREEPVWVGNAGKPGRRTAEHVLQVEKLLPQIGEVDLLVLLVGANDTSQTLSGRSPPSVAELEEPERRRRLLRRAFALLPPDYALHPPRRTALWTTVERLRRRLEIRQHWELIQDRGGSNYVRWREWRAGASRIRDRLPELGGPVEAYLANLRAVLAEARAHSVRTVFLTQPTIYRPDLPPQLRGLLWMGWVEDRRRGEGSEYYSPAALARAYEHFNGALRRFCREEGAECLDLARRLPKDTSVFYDDMHYNEAGAEKVARAVFEHLRAEPVAAARSAYGPREAP